MIRLSQPVVNEECIDEIISVIKSGMLVQGEIVNNFENDLSKYINSPYVIATSSGTASLHLALLALGIKKGDVVFLPAYTFPATANVVEVVGAEICLVDVELDTYNIDLKKLEKTIEEYKGEGSPKAIMVVHEFGAPCNMDEVMRIAKKHELYVIEDAACALGTKWNGQHVGTFGDVGCFSWHPRKAITTGEGGAVVVENKNIYKKLKLLRNHGIDRSKNGDIDFLLPGLNYRLTEFQAVMGRHQLKIFDSMLENKKTLATNYIDYLSQLEDISLPNNIEGHSWQTFLILLSKNQNQKDIIGKMREKGVETNLGAQAVHMMGYYKNKYNFKFEDYPNAGKLYKFGLALPLHSSLNIIDINYISNSLEEILISND